jgi:hypothetical protein
VAKAVLPRSAPAWSQTFGKVMERWFLPGLIVLGLICGGIAARSYNADADVFLKT